MELTYNYLKENNLIIFETIIGSQAYGTSIPTSDIDKKFIYILPKEHIYGFNYLPQLNVNKDYTGYEIKRFLELLLSANPTMLEILFVPEDCILYKHPIFDKLIECRDKFITKSCKNSFFGYAKQQISKSRGLKKKQNMEKDKIVRKTPIDFCYLHKGEHSIDLVKYMTEKGIDQKFCGLSKSPHGKDIYSLFYDFKSEETDGSQEYLSLGFRGIAFENSNDIRLSSIPMNLPKLNFIGHISYNKDGYTQHCNSYKEYQEWLKNRNTDRYTETKSIGQKDGVGSLIDSKNMMHCKRLIDMSMEIAQGKGVIVRRPDAEDLLKIRRGEVSLEELLQESETKISQIDELFEKSNIPDNIEQDFVDDLLVTIRKNFYERNLF